MQVRGMEHRQKREAEAEEQRRAKQAELDAQERKRAAAERLEQDAFERQLRVRLLTQHFLDGSGIMALSMHSTSRGPASFSAYFSAHVSQSLLWLRAFGAEYTHAWVAVKENMESESEPNA